MLFKLIVKHRTFSFLAFLVPFAMRVIPEVLAWPYIIGFNTIAYYVPLVLNWVNRSVGFWEFFGSAPLFYLLLYGLALAGVPLVVLSHQLVGVVMFAVVFAYALIELRKGGYSFVWRFLLAVFARCVCFRGQLFM